MDTIIHNNDNAVFPDSEHDYHGHPHYTRVLISLLALLSFSLVVGYAVSPTAAIVLIFGTAVWKTTLVMRNFMHLRFEPLFVFILVAAILLIIFAFFFGVYPDVAAIPHDVTLPR